MLNQYLRNVQGNVTLLGTIILGGVRLAGSDEAQPMQGCRTGVC